MGAVLSILPACCLMLPLLLPLPRCSLFSMHQEHMLSCLLDVARGLEYLHSKGLMHGDLKAGNVCLVKTQPATAPGTAAMGTTAAQPGTESSPAGCNGAADGGCRSNNSSSSRNAEGFDFVCKVRSSTC
jgi:hypothetical protein